jgi:hypothetical protein
MLRSNNGFITTLFLDGEGDPAGGAGTPTITIKHGDQEISVPRPAGLMTQKEVEEKYVLKAAHSDQMARMRKDLDGFKGLKPADEYLGDPEFKNKAMSTWGLLDPKATNEEYKAQLERQRVELLEREVKPRETKLVESGKTIEALRLKDLRGQILQAAAATSVEERYLKNPTKGGKALVVSMLEDAFAWDAESGEWYAKGASTGAPYAFSQSGETPYMTVPEFLATWAKGDGKDFVKSQRQAGAESNPSGGAAAGGISGQVGRELRLTAEQFRDIPFYKTMLAKAQKEGLTIVPA